MKLTDEEKNIIERHRKDNEHEDFINQFKFRLRVMLCDDQTFGFLIFNIEELFKKDSDFLRRYDILAIDRFTGRKDKKGSDIFESDIAKWGEYTLEIIWDEDNARFTYKIMNPKIIKEVPDIRLYRTEECAEVIGNTHKKYDREWNRKS